ncbi:hypothetical protein [Brevibacillus agri]|uniref:hypothetical protein n=1 Tax=Brevibacillus agri TaxID=51101 RepID=UPI003D1B53E1
MAKKKQVPRIFDKKKYIDFLANSNLGVELSESWFGNELLARALLWVLHKKGVVDYHEVVAEFQKMSKDKMRRMIENDLHPEEMPLYADFSTTQQEEDAKTRCITYESAYQEFSHRISMLIPRALLLKYRHEADSDEWDTPEVRKLCESMAACQTTEEMFDEFLVADQEIQRGVILKSFAFIRHLHLLMAFHKDEMVEVPDALVPALRLFLVGDWNSLEPDFEN